MYLPKILVLTTTYPTHENDWAGAFIQSLLLAIRKKGFEIEVVAPSNGQSYGNQDIHGIKVQRFGYFWPRYMECLTEGAGGIPENISKSFFAKIQVIPMMVLFVIKAFLAARRADIIYANWTGAGLVGAIISRVLGKPMVVSFRGDDGYLARDNCFWRIITKLVVKQAYFVTAVNSELLKIMKDLGVDTLKLELPRFGVDTAVFSPSARNENVNGPVKIIFVGSLIPKKGLQDLIQALADPEFRNISLIIVGDGYYSDNLKNLAREKLGHCEVIWKGITPPKEVALLMRQSDILVLPSYTEGSPNVVKEAMATGLPVIGTRVGGVPDLVTHEETGLLYNPGDIGALRNCLLRLVRNANMRTKMGSLSKKKLDQAGLNWDTTAADFERIFLRAIRRARYITQSVD
ncbi:MAG: glycosyltransferase [Desulfomonilaceae bacterium]